MGGATGDSLSQTSITPASSRKKNASGLTDSLRAEIADAAPEGIATLIAQVRFQTGLPLVGLKAQLVYEKLDQVGDLFYCHPPEPELGDLTELPCLILGAANLKCDLDTIGRKLQMDGVEDYDLESSAPIDSAAESKIVAQDPVPAASATTDSGRKGVTPSKPNRGKGRDPRPTEPVKKPTETLRVDIERLDQLMNLAGQLVINRARFAKIGDGLKGMTSSKVATHALSNSLGALDRLDQEMTGWDELRGRAGNLENIRTHVRRMRIDLETVGREVHQFGEARAMTNDLNEAVHQLDRVTDGIQKSVMETRMVPIGPLFGRFKRVIRDITRSNGKDIHLVIRGEKTELDKRMIDELGDPLIHMVRNSADHGIESPAEREATGKQHQGTVTLDAFHRGNSIVFKLWMTVRGWILTRYVKRPSRRESFPKLTQSGLPRIRFFN